MTKISLASSASIVCRNLEDSDSLSVASNSEKDASGESEQNVDERESDDDESKDRHSVEEQNSDSDAPIDANSEGENSNVRRRHKNFHWRGQFLFKIFLVCLRRSLSLFVFSVNFCSRRRLAARGLGFLMERGFF